MSSSEPVILRDLLFSKIPGSSRRKVTMVCNCISGSDLLDVDVRIFT